MKQLLESWRQYINEGSSKSRHGIISKIARSVVAQVSQDCRGGVYDVEEGLCGDVADFIWHDLRDVGIDVEIVLDLDFGKMLPTHNWVYDPILDMHFDAQNPEGVRDWRELEYWDMIKKAYGEFDFSNPEVVLYDDWKERLSK